MGVWGKSLFFKKGFPPRAFLVPRLMHAQKNFKFIVNTGIYGDF